MNLTKEKEKMLEIAEKESKNNLFESSDKCKVSYFTAYTDSKHIGGVIEEFSSEEMEDFRNKLARLWADDAEKKIFIPVILSAYIKSKDDIEGRFDSIETYNYMM